MKTHFSHELRGEIHCLLVLKSNLILNHNNASQTTQVYALIPSSYIYYMLYIPTRSLFFAFYWLRKNGKKIL